VTADEDARFEPVGDLPSGRLAIQASAGTGKTSALASLATRFIAEGGIAASELLIVTFTRAATTELRARVRSQLIEISDVLAGDVEVPTDHLLAHHLASDDRQLRLDRLRKAITEFDAATITTIHGFATQVRGALGASSAVDPDALLIDDALDLIEEVCADVLAWAAMHDYAVDDLPALSDLEEATRYAVGEPDLALIPTSDSEGATSGQRLLHYLVERAEKTMVDRRRRSRTMSFDDVMIQLRRGLEGPGSAAVIEMLRNRFKVALIDEFQDTDSVQWDIFSKLFGVPDAGTTLVMVGDPKQAIYRFRGADIHTYLEATGEGSGTERRSLLTNWRSDGAVLRSLEALLDGATFGDQHISYVPVDAAPANLRRRLTDSDGGPLPALTFGMAIGEGITRNKNSSQVQVDAAAQAIDLDLVSRIRALLQSAHIPCGSGDEDRRPVGPSDLAVLVITRAQGEAVQRALLGQGVPAVIAGGGSVLESPAADQMRSLLDAMGHPADPRRARMYAMSWFVGWSADLVASAPEASLAELQGHLREWSDMLTGHAVADVFARIWSETGVVARVLGGADGDRNITDLGHLVELLHGAAPTGTAGVAGLIRLLDAEPDDDAEPDSDGNVAARRVESEAEAVQIMTIWKAKGLEFPVVLLPTLWRHSTRSQPVIFSDPTTGTRTFDLTKGGEWPDKASGMERKGCAARELEGERLRLLYVALTRAKHHTVVWWANASNSNKTALAHLLFARSGGDLDPKLYGRTTVGIPSDADVVAALVPLSDRAEGTIAVEVVDAKPAPIDRWVARNTTRVLPELQLAEFVASPDRSKQRWSFSAITQTSSPPHFDPYDPSMGDSGAGDEHGSGDAPLEGDGRELDAVVAAPPLDATGSLGLLTDLPAGAAFGTLVHAVLEDIDFKEPDLDEQLTAAVDRQLAWRSLDLTPRSEHGGTPDEGRRFLIDGLRAAIGTPLGPLCEQLRLTDIDAGDRLNEISFDLCLGEAGRIPTMTDIGRLMATHLEPGDPLRGWATDLADGVIDMSLAGHLTGSIDLVIRIHDDQGGGRFVVADYKTNALTKYGHIASPDDYRPPRLAEAMADHDYPLQAVLYSVALHRYLRWRLPDYVPATHLGGVVYLFLRGMTGPEVAVSHGQPHGVFNWPVPPALVSSLSDLLDGQPVAELVS
jgi:exodeoxyribonuclease V beta subunit